MKCQKCEKAATFHITEITDGDHVALHLCADCAEQYLKPSGGAGTVGEALAQHLSVGQTTDEMAKLDQKACPVCGITYYEFRKYGRLGCPHDYVHFEAELESLIVNIHGEVRHRGKRPPKPPADAAVATELIRLRREMKEAIDGENYELASQIRDRIRRLEKEGQR